MPFVCLAVRVFVLVTFVNIPPAAPEMAVNLRVIKTLHTDF